MSNLMLILCILNAILFIANIVISIKDKDISSILGWFCALIWIINYMVK